MTALKRCSLNRSHLSRRLTNNVVGARSGRTGWTGEVQQRGSETYRQESSDPANLGLDPAKYMYFYLIHFSLLILILILIL